MVKIHYLLLGLALSAGCSQATESSATKIELPASSHSQEMYDKTILAMDNPSNPQDIKAFLENASLCHHLAGEWDNHLTEKEMAEMKQSMDDVCPKAAQAQPQLLEKYKNDKRLAELISFYEF